MKKLGKSILVILIIIVVLIGLLLASPALFKGKILSRVETELNKNLNANVDFDEKAFKLSLIKGFPNLYIEMNDLSVSGIDDFEKDTLLQFSKFAVKVNLMSAIKKNVEVKSILLDKPIIKAIKNKKGQMNWDIAKPSDEIEEEEVEDTTAAEPLGMKVALKRFEIKDASIFYIDDSTGMLASLENFNFLLKGDLGEDFSKIVMNTTTEKVNFKMDGMKYVNDMSLDFHVDLDANLKENHYKFNENSFAFNELVLGIDGEVSMPDTQNIDLDIQFSTKETGFKSLLSMVPATFAKDLEGVETDGSLKLNGYAKGRYNTDTMPSAGLNLVVNNARFQYPDLPKSVENIQIDIGLLFDGIHNDNSKVDVNKFHLEMAGNPFDMLLKLRNPMTDPRVETKIKGMIDLATLADVVPLEDMTLIGLVKTDIFMAGSMSMIENENYEAFNAEGSLELSGIKFNSPDVPAPVTIKETNLLFSPRYAELKAFDMEIGESDIQLQGKMENFIPYIFSDGTVSGDFVFTSNYLNVNQFLTETEEDVVEEETVDTATLVAPEIPKNINFRLATNLDKVKYDKLDIDNIKGIIHVHDGIAELQKLKMNLLEGSMDLDGYYSTEYIAEPRVNMNFNMKRIDIPSAFEAFNTIQKLAPAAQHAKGDISMSMKYNSLLNPDMTPALETIDGFGSFESKSIVIGNSKALAKIGEKLNSDKFKSIALQDVAASFEIKDGRVSLVEPITAKFGKSSMEMTGSQGIDQTMDYNMDFEIPRSELGRAANQAIDKLSQQAASQGLDLAQSKELFVNAKIGGTFTEPTIKLNLKESAESVVQDVKEQVQERIEEEVNKIVDEGKDRAREEADKIIREAEAQAKKIKAAGKASADKIRREADKAYEDAMDKVSGQPKLLRSAAEAAAKKAKSEAYDKADKIEREANQNANKVIEEAKKKAAAL